MNVYTKKHGVLLKKNIIGLFLLFLFILLLNIFEYQIKNYFHLASRPAAIYFNRVGSNFPPIFRYFFNIQNINNENEKLKKENQKLLSEVFGLKDYLRENLEIKELENNIKYDNFRFIRGKVIGLDTYNNFILINKGSDDGISENMSVVSEQKFLYGKVFKAYKNFSQIMLISNKESVLNVKINSLDSTDLSSNDLQKPVYGVLRGYGSLSIYLDLIDSKSVIKENDVLVTSGLEGVFPVNLLVGKVKSVDKNDIKPFQAAEVQPFFDISHIDDLFIITNYIKI